MNLNTDMFIKIDPKLFVNSSMLSKIPLHATNDLDLNFNFNSANEVKLVCKQPIPINREKNRWSSNKLFLSFKLSKPAFYFDKLLLKFLSSSNFPCQKFTTVTL